MDPSDHHVIRQPGAAGEPDGEAVDVVVVDDGDGALTLDPSGAVTIEHEDGSVTVDLSGRADEDDDEADAEHFANIADKLDDATLSTIAETLLQGIEADDASRGEWLEGYAEGVKLLGLQIKKPAQADGAAPLEGMSTVDHPLLLEAVLRFWANAEAELLPSAGPVKVRDDATTDTPKALSVGHNGGPPLDTEPTRDELAEALEKDLNHYLTVTAREYVPDTRRMLLKVGLCGSQFKKVYRCPLRRRPVSETVDIKDLIVSNAATDLWGAGRVTHRIVMRRSVLKRMQLAGAYRDVELNVQPAAEPNAADAAIAEQQGTDPVPPLPEDVDYEIYECAAELDVPGYEHKDEAGKPTGLDVPWVVTIERNSRQVLAIRRNWDEDDEHCLPLNRFVHYLFIPGLGFYGIGLGHVLGNTTKALTAAERIGLDSGMFANFPGFLYLASAMRKNQSTSFRVPPGGGAPIETTADDIRKVVMELPYKDLTPGFAALVKQIAEDGARLGGTAQISVGEGRQDAPVGTTIAMIEQATKVVAAVHKGLHQAQGEEFQLLRDELRRDPSPLWRHKRSELRKYLGITKTSDDAALEQAKARVVQALDDWDLVPVADPNTPSHMHRLMKAVALIQLTAGDPQWDAKEIKKRAMKMIGISDPDSLEAPPPPPSGMPQPTPDAQLRAMTDKETKMAAIQAKDIADQRKYADADKERAHERDMKVADLAQTLAIHPEASGKVEQMVSPGNRSRVI